MRWNTATAADRDLLQAPFRAGTDAGGALGREALDAGMVRQHQGRRSAATLSTAGMVASGASIKAGEALPREALDAADVLLDVPAASCPGRRGPIGCFGIEN